MKYASKLLTTRTELNMRLFAVTSLSCLNPCLLFGLDTSVKNLQAHFVCSVLILSICSQWKIKQQNQTDNNLLMHALTELNFMFFMHGRSCIQRDRI